MEDGKSNGKDEGQGTAKAAEVVQITDRRTASGAKQEAAKAPEIPDGPRDRNAAVRPMTVNRNAIDPMILIREGKGTARDRDRAILQAVQVIADVNGATRTGFQQVTTALSVLMGYLRAVDHRSARFWRRWFTRRPALPDLAQVMRAVREQVGQQAAVEQAQAERPAGEPS
jgi:hypothetical protein